MGSVLTFALFGVASVLHLITYINLDWVENFFALIPVNTLMQHWYLWNVLTSSLFEKSFLRFALKGCVFVLGGMKLEKAWGPRVLGKLIAITAICSGGITFLFMAGLYVSGLEKVLFVDQYGFAGLCTSILVGLVKNDKNFNLGVPMLRIRYTVLPFLCVYTLFWGLGIVVVRDLSFAWISFFVGFAYLNGVKNLGNCDDDFTFDVFFPDLVRPFLRAGVLMTISFLARLGVGSNATFGPILPHRSNESSFSVPKRKTTLDAVAERRRAKALRALDAKLAQMSREQDAPLDLDMQEDIVPSAILESPAKAPQK